MLMIKGLMKKLRVVGVLFFVSVFLCGCGDDSTLSTDVTGTTNVKYNIVDEDFNETGTGVLKCSAEAIAGEGIDVDLNYTVKYKNGNVLEIVSVQKISSINSDDLDLYEEAYKKIASNYDGLKYYKNEIVRKNDSLIYTISINYDKIDIERLLEIEGEDDNIVKDGKAKLSLWLDLASKIGTRCENA